MRTGDRERQLHMQCKLIHTSSILLLTKVSQNESIILIFDREQRSRGPRNYYETVKLVIKYYSQLAYFTLENLQKKTE